MGEAQGDDERLITPRFSSSINSFSTMSLFAKGSGLARECFGVQGLVGM